MRAHALALIIGVIAVSIFLRAIGGMDQHTRDALFQVPTQACIHHGFQRAETIGGEWYCVADGRESPIKIALERLEERHR